MQNATHTRVVSLAAIPLDTDIGDPDKVIPNRGVYQQQTQITNARRASLPLAIADNTWDTSPQ